MFPHWSQKTITHLFHNRLLGLGELLHSEKSGRHLEFSMNDIIRRKIIHVAKMATKDESSVNVAFAVCSYKMKCFYFISRGIFSLYNVFMGMLLLRGISRQQTIFLIHFRFLVRWFDGSMVRWSSVTAALCSLRFA